MQRNFSNVMRVPLVLVLHFFSIYCNFNTVLQSSNKPDLSGYSVLLQGGRIDSYAIIGSPRSDLIERCILDDKSVVHCVPYKISDRFSQKIKPFSYSGLLLAGDNFTGGELAVCGSRTPSDSHDDYLTGECFVLKNSSELYHNVCVTSTFQSAQVNLKYRKTPDIKELLLGQPYIRDEPWGNVRRIDFTLEDEDSEDFIEESDIPNLNATYFGYSLTWGNFIKSSTEFWYVVGAPRGAKLYGKVILLQKEPWDESNLIKELSGEGFGSYFGAIVEVVTINGVDSLLVGAPTYSGESYDEGCVYLYINMDNGNFYPPVKLLGDKKTASRFGTTVSVLGDINLDSYKDIAVGAPYDSEMGAVYIYLGFKGGIETKYSQKLLPSEFNKIHGLPQNVLGFGLGISNGNDIDFNGQNDIVIGTYQSGLTFVLKSFTTVDYDVQISETFNISTSNLEITFCVKFSSRVNIVDYLSTAVDTTLGHRTIGTRKTEKGLNLTANISSCFSDNHFITYDNVEPYRIEAKCTPKKPGTRSSKTDAFVKEVLLHEDVDKVYKANLSLRAEAGKRYIVLGLDEVLKIKVTIINTKESAFFTKLVLVVPDFVGILDNMKFEKENGQYIAKLFQLLENSTTLNETMSLDIRNIPFSTEEIPIKYEIPNSEQDKIPKNNTVLLKVPVVVQNNPFFMESKSNPISIQLRDLEENKNVTFSQKFTVANKGPSPHLIDLNIFVPNFAEKAIVRGVSDYNEVECRLQMQNASQHFNVSLMYRDDISDIEHNESYYISCSFVKCLQFRCQGYLLKFNERAVFTVKLSMPKEVFAGEHFTEKWQDRKKPFKDIIIFETAAVMTNKSHSTLSTVCTPVYGFIESEVPFWVTIISAVSGILLFAIMALTFHRAGFFTRTYKKKLELAVEATELDHTEDVCL